MSQFKKGDLCMVVRGTLYFATWAECFLGQVVTLGYSLIHPEDGVTGWVMDPPLIHPFIPSSNVVVDESHLRKLDNPRDEETDTYYADKPLPVEELINS